MTRQIQEANRTKTKTKTQDTDWTDIDNLFRSASDQPLAPSQERDREQPDRDGDQPNDVRRRASQADTLRAAGNVSPTDRMRDLMSRMRDIDADPDDPGYPVPDETDNLPDVRVTVDNLPAVVGQQLRAAGTQDPKFHQVANLPGNMSRAIRTLGRQLFRSFTRTPTDDIWMIGQLGGQGPNTRQEVNAVAGWVRDNGERITQGDIDFDTTIPGYSADIQQWSAGGIRWLMVRDEFGDYIYSWPEQDSTQPANDDDEPQLDRPQRQLGR